MEKNENHMTCDTGTMRSASEMQNALLLTKLELLLRPVGRGGSSEPPFLGRLKIITHMTT